MTYRICANSDCIPTLRVARSSAFSRLPDEHQGRRERLRLWMEKNLVSKMFESTSGSMPYLLPGQSRMSRCDSTEFDSQISIQSDCGMRGARITYVLDELAHPALRDPASAEDLDGVLSGLTRASGAVLLEECNRTINAIIVNQSNTLT